MSESLGRRTREEDLLLLRRLGVLKQKKMAERTNHTRLGDNAGGRRGGDTETTNWEFIERSGPDRADDKMAMSAVDPRFQASNILVGMNLKIEHMKNLLRTKLEPFDPEELLRELTRLSENCTQLENVVGVNTMWC